MRNNLLVAAVLGLSVAGLAACSGGEQKETMDDAAAKVSAPSTMRSDQPTAPAATQAAPAQPAPEAAPAPQAPEAAPAPDAVAPEAAPDATAPGPQAPEAAPGPQAPGAAPGPQAPEAAPGPQAPEAAPGPQQQAPQGQHLAPDAPVQPATPADDNAADGMNSATFNSEEPSTTPGTAQI